MASVSPSAVRERWMGSGIIPDESVLVTLIEDAEDTIRAAIPDLDERIGDGRVPESRLSKIVARMVIRHARNPEGFRQMQETTGPFTRGYTHGGEEPGSLYLSPTEKRELLGAQSGRAFQIDTTPPITRRGFDAERYA